MAESSNTIEPGQVNLRKTFNINNQNGGQNNAGHYVTIDGESSTTNGKSNLNQSMIITTDKKNMVIGNSNSKNKPQGLNDSIVIMSGSNNKQEASQRKSI